MKRSRPFRYPRPERLDELVAEQREGAKVLAGAFLEVCSHHDLSKAFELLLAMRIAEQWPPLHALRVYLLLLHEWQPFVLSLVALGSTEAPFVVDAVLRDEERLPEGDAILGDFRYALARYVKQRMGHPIDHDTRVSLAYATPLCRDPKARGCLELLQDDAEPRDPWPKTVKAFVDWALSTPLGEWMRASTSPLASHERAPGRRPS